MRRVLVSGVVALVALAAGVVAVPEARAAATQVEEGVVLLPSRGTDPSGTRPFIHTGLYRDVGPSTNGSTFWMLEIDPAVAGGRFELELLAGASGSEDLDVAFFDHLRAGEARKIDLWASHSGPGEKGKIPLWARYAYVALFKGADARFRFTARALGPQAPRFPAVPSKPGIYPEFGKSPTADRAAVQQLRSKPHVVVAVVDSGINPYHETFRRPELVVHPSEYISGFPVDAPALALSFREQTYDAARGRDDAAIWQNVGGWSLYWVPGTNIIGAYSADPQPFGDTNPPYPSRPILDDHRLGHGTGVASLVGGLSPNRHTGLPQGIATDALIVAVEGTGALEWAVEQPWIDMVNGSFSDTDDDVASATGTFVLRDGRTACFAAGNGVDVIFPVPNPTLPFTTAGPSWVVTVGGSSQANGQAMTWSGVPSDVVAVARASVAHPTSFEDELENRGTSYASPTTCGAFATALLEARRALRDHREGIHVAPDGSRVPAVGSCASSCPGMLGDGVLTRLELQDAMFKTAFPPELTPDYPDELTTWPTSPAFYMHGGYGVVDRESAARAVEIILGRAPLPARDDVDRWMMVSDRVRDALYPPDDYD